MDIQEDLDMFATSRKKEAAESEIGKRKLAAENPARKLFKIPTISDVEPSQNLECSTRTFQQKIAFESPMKRATGEKTNTPSVSSHSLGNSFIAL